MNTQKNIIVFFGPPGSGKGSLSKLCVDRLNWVQVSTGNLCREHITNKTEIGKKIDFIIKSGKLIDDTIINEMIKDLLKNKLKNSISLILDGYPRTINQAEALIKYLSSKDFYSVKLHIIKMSVSDKTVMSRLLSRIICSNKSCQAVYSLKTEELKSKNKYQCDVCSEALIRREDDSEEAIKERLKVYRVHEEKLINYYQKIGQGILQLELEKGLEDIYLDFLNKIGLRPGGIESA